jgi:hypothetical protein
MAQRIVAKVALKALVAPTGPVARPFDRPAARSFAGE